MSKRTQWMFMALVLVNVAVLLPYLFPSADSIVLGLILGAGIAHTLHGAYGCDYFPESERGASS